ncbi:MAG: AAA family ATPase [Legionellales bacterium]|nr:AAA family ATPase [Legionellales bacterium]
MYLEHFGLKEAPFSLTPNTEYFLNVQGYQEALNTLLVGLENCDAFIKVTGEVGTGKTLLCRKLYNSLGEQYHVIYLRMPCTTEMDLFFAVAKALRVKEYSRLTKPELLNAIEGKLATLHRLGKRTVLLVDEAQTLSPRALEALRLLTNQETETDKLLQIVMFGQSELDERLKNPRLRQLRQRIVFSYSLKPMDRHALGLYIHHRLFVAGYEGDVLFTPKALDMLYKASNGIPRVVNILSHKALLVGFGQGMHRVTDQHVSRAVNDSGSSTGAVKAPNLSLRPELQLGIAVLIVCGVGLFLFEHLGV